LDSTHPPNSIATFNNGLLKPNANWNGATSFTYAAVDNDNLQSANATASITVNQALTVHVNALPVVSAQTFTGDEDTVMTVTLSGTDTDGTVTAIKIMDLPAHGNLYRDSALTQMLSANTFVSVNQPLYFKPDANWSGSTAFNYQATDNTGAVSSSATATLNVSAVADAPVLDQRPITMVSTSASDQQGNDWSGNASVSADGRYVVFESEAYNLVAGDDNGQCDIFLKDTQTGAIRRVSTSASDQQGNGWSAMLASQRMGAMWCLTVTPTI
jgi:hypothetical protein